MAQAKKKRRKKHKGTQGGRIDTNRRRAKPRTRAEAKSQARARRTPTGKVDNPPTWRSSVIRGIVAAVIFSVLLALIFKRSLGASLALGGFMLVFYIPAGYYIDMAMWRKRERARIREREVPK
ncbi:MAG TPA: hypothetical protein VIT85_06610 [Solirubrobacterales bacterium]